MSYIYSKDDINRKYHYKRFELLNVIQRINETKPKGITYEVRIDKNMYLVIFKFENNNKYRFKNKEFLFHTQKTFNARRLLKDGIKNELLEFKINDNNYNLKDYHNILIKDDKSKLAKTISKQLLLENNIVGEVIGVNSKKEYSDLDIDIYDDSLSDNIDYLYDELNERINNNYKEIKLIIIDELSFINDKLLYLLDNGYKYNMYFIINSNNELDNLLLNKINLKIIFNESLNDYEIEGDYIEKASC